jgi:hypothetical protein
MKINAEWEEKREWRAEDGPREDHPRGVWAKHTGIIVAYVDRTINYQRTDLRGVTENQVRAILYEPGNPHLVDKSLTDVFITGVDG